MRKTILRPRSRRKPAFFTQTDLNALCDCTEADLPVTPRAATETHNCDQASRRGQLKTRRNNGRPFQDGLDDFPESQDAEDTCDAPGAVAVITEEAAPVVPARRKKLKSKPLAPPLPNILASEGLLQRALDQSSEAASHRDSAAKLHRRVSDDIKYMRRADDCTLMLAHRPMDPVLDYVVAVQRGDPSDALEDLADRAWYNYLDHMHDYDLVLGNLIPGAFRHDAKQALCRKAYREGSNITAVDDWPGFEEVLQYEQARRKSGQIIATGLPKIDKALDGLGALTFVAADRGDGKTTWLLNVVVAALRSDPELAVLFYTLDMAKTRLYQRLLSYESGVDYRMIRVSEKTADQDELLHDAAVRLQKDILPRLRMIERAIPRAAEGLTFETVWTQCKALLNVTKARRLLIVVDLFQRMDPPIVTTDDIAKDHCRLDLFKEIQGASRSVEQPDGYTILAASEIRKEQGNRRELTKDDLLGSSRIASDAETILLMWPSGDATNRAAPVIPMTFRIEKGRDGQVRKDIKLWFDHTRSRFTDKELKSLKDQFCTATKSLGVQPPKVDPLAGMKRRGG